MSDTMQDATSTPTGQVTARNGVSYAYRRFGTAQSAALPLLCFTHYRANLDNWDPLPTPNSYLLAERIPNARLSIYPDAGHGFLFQHPKRFAAEVNAFLGTVEE